MSPTDVFISNNTRSGQSGKPLVSVRPRCRRQRQRGERRLETHNDDENLFIRLSPKLIQTLQSDLEATAAASFSDPIRTQEHHSCWNYLIHGDGDFLPLQISFLDKDGTKTERETLYTSFNGGRLEDEEEDIIEVPNSFMPSSSNRADDSGECLAFVRALPYVQHCTRVQMEPKSIEDWELLEAYAQSFEEGGLLKQVSVVFNQQLLTLQLPTSSAVKVRLIVGEISTTRTSETSGLWPPLSSDHKEDDNRSSCCDYALLVQNTEVIIQPKLRPTNDDDCEWSAPLRLIPCCDEWPADMQYLSQQQQAAGDHQQPLGVSPGHILVNQLFFDDLSARHRKKTKKKKKDNITRRHPDHYLARIRADCPRTSSIPSSQQQQKSKSCFVRVMVSTRLTIKNRAALHPWTRFDLGLSLYTDSVQILPCGEEPATISLLEDDILLQPVCIKHQPTEQQPWRIPDANPANRQMDSIAPPNRCDISCPSPLFQIGSLISTRLHPDKRGGSESGMFRLSLRNETDSFGLLIDKQSVKLVQKKLDEVSIESGTKGLDFSLVDEPKIISVSTVGLKCVVPPPIVTSIDWARDFLLRQQLAIDTCEHVAVCGPAGSGKTYSSLLLGLLSSIEQHKPILYLDCARLQDSSVRLSCILDEIGAIFQEASRVRSAVIVLDDLDRLIPDLLGGDENDPASRVQGTNPVAVDQSKTISDLICQHIDALNNKNGPEVDNGLRITIISTCPSIGSLNHGLREAVTTECIDIPTLSRRERDALLRQMLNGTGPGLIKWDDIDLPEISETFRPRDLAKVVSRVRQKLSVSQETPLPRVALEEVISEYVPMSNLTLSERKTATGPDWDGIGGLTAAKSRLESMLLHPTRYHGIYSRASVRLPRGLLLFGPPGCGKSILVPALAKLCGFPLLSCRGPEVLDKYIGASEAKIRELFDRAIAVAPSILFLDELDALAPRRGSDHTGVTDRVVNQLLTYLDGVEDAAKRTVYVIGASSRPDKIDPALLRPGRLEEHLFIGPPRDDKEWVDLLTKVSQGWNISSDCRDCLSMSPEDETLSALTKSGRFTAADFKACLDTAHVAAVHRALASSPPAETLNDVVISKGELQSSIINSKPCLGADDARMLGRVYQPFMRNHDSGFDRSVDASKGVELKTTLR